MTLDGVMVPQQHGKSLIPRQAFTDEHRLASLYQLFSRLFRLTWGSAAVDLLGASPMSLKTGTHMVGHLLSRTYLT